MTPSRFKKFFTSVRSIVPRDRVVDETLETIDSSGLPRSCAGLILVKNESEVTKVMRAADRCGIPIDPISTGFNVGYGDFLPENRKSVILDLRKMDRILELNREEGWIRIEPGVSQAQVAAYLKKSGAPFEFDLTYWLKEASVIGNSLERGRTLVSERERDLIGAKLVLSTGEILRTGFHPSAKSPLQSGLNLHALIFQSNLGIIVEGIVRLKPRVVGKTYWLIESRSFEKLASECVGSLRQNESPALRPLRWFCEKTYALAPVHKKSQQGRVANRGGALAVEADGRLSAAQFRKILKSTSQCTVQKISREKLLSPLEPNLTPVPVPLAFFSFSIRNSGRGLLEARKFIGQLRKRFPLHFFETISFLDSTSAVFLLRAQMENARDTSKAGFYFRQISQAIAKQGYTLYRSHSGLADLSDTNLDLKKKIKASFDPKGLVAPGRYGL